jgi:hypothetical protein
MSQMFTANKKMYYKEKTPHIFFGIFSDYIHGYKDKKSIYKNCWKAIGKPKSSDDAQIPQKYIVQSTYLDILQNRGQKNIDKEISRYEKFKCKVRRPLQAIIDDIKDKDASIAESNKYLSELKTELVGITGLDRAQLKYKIDLVNTAIKNQEDEKLSLKDQEQTIRSVISENNSMLIKNINNIADEFERGFGRYVKSAGKKIRNKLGITQIEYKACSYKYDEKKIIDKEGEK